MSWDPDTLTSAERRIAAKTVVQVQVLLNRLVRSNSGDEVAFARVDDMLAMMYEDLYGLDLGVEDYPPPSAS